MIIFKNSRTRPLKKEKQSNNKKPNPKFHSRHLFAAPASIPTISSHFYIFNWLSITTSSAFAEIKISCITLPKPTQKKCCSSFQWGPWWVCCHWHLVPSSLRALPCALPCASWSGICCDPQDRLAGTGATAAPLTRGLTNPNVKIEEHFLCWKNTSKGGVVGSLPKIIY